METALATAYLRDILRAYRMYKHLGKQGQRGEAVTRMGPSHISRGVVVCE